MSGGAEYSATEKTIYHLRFDICHLAIGSPIAARNYFIDLAGKQISK
jgi:hypothetical protein